MRKQITLLDRISESVFLNNRKGKRLLREAGEDAMGGDPNAMGGMGDPNGGMDDGSGMGADPNADPNAMGGGADGAMGGGDPNAMGGADPNAQGGDMGGAMPPMDGGMGDPMGGADMGEEGGEDDDTETLNIDDLTNAQSKMNDKINAIGKGLGSTDKRISDLLSSVEGLISTIDNQNAEIQKLQKDIVARNPKPTETIQLQTLQSFPYNQGIDDYWEDFKERNSNYVIDGGRGNNNPNGVNYDNIGADDEEEEKVYEITTDDVDDMDEADIYKSFGLEMDDDDDHNWFKPRF